MQDEPNWHRADTDKYESEGEGELYEFGQESLDRIALALGGNTVAPLASSLLPTLLQDADWKKRHAALICISQIAEGCVKVLVKNVHGLADMCIQVCHARNLASSVASAAMMCAYVKGSSKEHVGSRLGHELQLGLATSSAHCKLEPRLQAYAASRQCTYSHCDHTVPTHAEYPGRLLMLLWREVQGLRDQHPKVRWAACQAVGQMCTDLGPDFQEAEHARLLPGLMAVMDDFNHPRIQAHSAAAVVNFSENCEQVPCSISTSAHASAEHVGSLPVTCPQTAAASPR